MVAENGLAPAVSIAFTCQKYLAFAASVSGICRVVSVKVVSATTEENMLSEATCILYFAAFTEGFHAKVGRRGTPAVAEEARVGV